MAPTLVHISTASRTVRFPERSVDLALDDATWRALEDCLAHRRALHTDNPHVLVTRLVRVATGPVGAAHIRESFPRVLRFAWLLILADELDVKQLTVALGMSYSGTAHYR
ncbi:hypothetical protein ACIA98_42980 [Streptomyces sp. NPDC051366]|uniref:hypothetical protein n=1 Tax=Streptomyces sp. NPDC051366 TaxID=3365652 RepID=UPI003794B94B